MDSFALLSAEMVSFDVKVLIDNGVLKIDDTDFKSFGTGTYEIGIEMRIDGKCCRHQ